ncbi:hypothetical protein AACH10_14050 [Ideonella sp. DXS22W]|uniref:Uncharacterized protein n=1 Tax=Pseudaquabacterium inlustre TaxID=2984192 RepID=A0ABU9CHP2_9BURK
MYLARNCVAAPSATPPGHRPPALPCHADVRAAVEGEALPDLRLLDGLARWPGA